MQGYTNTFTITVNPTKLIIDKTLDPINVNLDSQITPTIDISGSIKTDTEESVSGVTFTCENLPNGLSIDQSTGVILEQQHRSKIQLFLLLNLVVHLMEFN